MSTQPPAITPVRIAFATPETAAAAAAATGSTPTSMPGEVSAGLVEAITAELGAQADDTDLKLAELKRQNAIYVETDTDKREKLNEDFTRQVLGSTTLMPFVGMRGGFLRIIHTLQRYGGDYMGEGSLAEAIIGFLGDRLPANNPLAAHFDDSFFEWKEEAVIDSELTLRSFYKDEGSRRGLYTPITSDSTSQLDLPPILLVPRGMLSWLAEKPRTPWEYREELLRDIGGSDADNRPAVLNLSLAWLRNQCLVGDKAKKSRGELQFEPVFGEDSPHLQRWLDSRVDLTLGKRAQGSSAQVVNNFYSPAPQNGGREDIPQEDRSFGGTKKEKDKMKPSHRSALRGYSACLKDHDCAPVWDKLDGETDIDELRKAIMKAWNKTRESMHIDAGECNTFFLEDEMIKEWMKMNLAPGTGSASLENVMKGISPLLFMPYSADKQADYIQTKQIYEETKTTRTEEQALRLLKKGSRLPPVGWSNVKYTLNTYAIMLRTLFTMYCPFYKHVWDLRQAVVDMKDHKSYFGSRTMTGTMFWHIITNAVRFFGKQLMPEDFDGATDVRDIEDWPRSRLSEIATLVLDKRHAAMDTMDVPMLWQDKKRNQADFGDRSGGQRDDGGSKKSRGDGGGGGGRVLGLRHNVTPRKIRERLGRLIDEVRRIDPRVAFKDFVLHGGLRYSDVPTLPNYSQGGRSNLCKLGLMGLCGFDDDRCSFRRVDERDITDVFADSFASVMTPAMEQYIAYKSGNRGGGDTHGGGYDDRRGGGSGGGQYGRGGGYGNPRGGGYESRRGGGNEDHRGGGSRGDGGTGYYGRGR